MKNDEQRQELLEAFKDQDKEAWAKYQSARLLKVQIVLERAFEAQLDIAAAQLAEDIAYLDEVAFVNSIQSSYTTYLLIAGFSRSQATVMAQSFASSWRPVRRPRPGF